MTFPKRPSNPPPAPGVRPSQVPSAPGARPSTIPSVRPGNVRDALTEAQAVAGGGLAKQSTRPSVLPQARKTVLLVDPDPTTRTKLKDALAPFYDILEAGDGMEAVELASRIQAPAMIVSEVPMPRVDGLTLAKTLRQNPVMKKVPIMFVSSRNNPQDVTAALVIGVTQFVPKTTPVADLVARIRRIII
jgi:CheY-like chemotaxis protein